MKFSVHVVWLGRDVIVATYDSEKAAVSLADLYELDRKISDVWVEYHCE